MFFSSNQILQVSGEFDNIENALIFALKLSGHDKNMTQKEKERGCKLVYQITSSGRYCIGWGFGNVPSGWSEYPFDFQTDIVAKIIAQYLKKQTCVNEDVYEDGDGSYDKGFIMKHDNSIYEYDCNGKTNIENPFYCIVYFQAFETYYGK
jgi:hypothetical protein